MTVREWLRAAIENIPVEENILEWAMSTSVEVGLKLVSLDADYYEVLADEELNRSLRYALSSLYYYASGQNGGSSRHEQVGDISVTVSSWTLDWTKRNLWLRKADAIRKALGFDPEGTTTEQGGMFDASNLRNRPPRRRRSWN